MAKYSLAFKLRVFRYWDQHDAGSEATAEHFQIDRSLVRQWCDVYSVHGKDGLRKRYRHHSSAYKAAVLRQMASEGWSIRQTCAIFNIPAFSTLQQWQRAFAEGGMAALEPKRRGRPPKMAKHKPHSPPLTQRPKAPENMTPEEMSEELDYLRAENAFLSMACSPIASPRWGGG
ncbi:MAG: helix-turn-helix domain-containing protein [Pseudomonadota bacterium]